MNYQVELLHSLLHDFLDNESALMTTDGQVLAVKGFKASSFGPLTTAANTVLKYLPLQEGEIAILNDPFSGGSHLNSITFVMAISEDLIWALTKERPLDLRIVQNVEAEGLRIPPTPIVQKGVFNEMILTAMSAHPECAPEFILWLQDICKDIAPRGQKLFNALEQTGFTITSELIKEYLELCKASALHAISERAYGDARVDVRLDSGELLRLNVEVSKSGVKLDFSGSSTSQGIALTEAATYGACFQALARQYGFEQMANSGTFSLMQISKPAGCWLLARYPQSTLRGMLCGVPAIQSAIEMAFAQIHKKTEQSYSNHCPLYFQAQSNNVKRSFTLNPGQGANASHNGRSAIFNETLLEMETALPIQISRVGLRTRSTPEYKHQGGLGVEVHLQALDDVQFTWMTDLTGFKPREIKNLHPGENSEIIWSDQNESKPLKSSDSLHLKKGESLILRSPNGGDFGKEKQKEPQ